MQNQILKKNPQFSLVLNNSVVKGKSHLYRQPYKKLLQCLNQKSIYENSISFQVLTLMSENFTKFQIKICSQTFLLHIYNFGFHERQKVQEYFALKICPNNRPLKMQALLQFQKNIKLYCTQYEFQNNSYQYKISITYRSQKSQKYTIYKTKKQLQKFHQSIQKYIFELDEPFNKKYIQNQDPQETVDLINVYLNDIQQRLDCLTSGHFVNFFEFDTQLKNISKPLTKEYIEELTDITISSKEDQVVDIEWQPQQKILFVVSQCKKPKKIQNLFKLLISNEIGVSGKLQMVKFSQEHKNWVNVCTQKIEAEPIKITWNSRSSLLVLTTTIGIHVYMVALGTQKSNMNLIDFVQLPGISSVCCDYQIAQVYVLSSGINYQQKSRLYAYSIKKESAIEIPLKLTHAKSVVFQKTNRRLFISDSEEIKIFKVQNDSQKIIFENFKFLHTIKHDSDFQQLKLSSEQKPQFLFGYNKKGFVTVFQIKPLEKEYLMTELTTIECPSNFVSIQKIWKNKMFCTNFGNHLVFISMKNQPIWVKENGLGRGNIKKILFDEENQRLMFCDSMTLKICQMNF